MSGFIYILQKVAQMLFYTLATFLSTVGQVVRDVVHAITLLVFSIPAYLCFALVAWLSPPVDVKLDSLLTKDKDGTPPASP